MSADQTGKQEAEAPAMKAEESDQRLEVTSPEAAEANLKDRLAEAEKLRAALLNGEAAKPEASEQAAPKDADKKAPPEPQKETEAEAERKEETLEEKTETEEAVPDWKAKYEEFKAQQRKKDGVRGSELEKLRRQVENLSKQLEGKQDAEVKGTPVADAMEDAQAKKEAEAEHEPSEAELIEEYGPNYEAEVGREWAVKNLKALNRRAQKIRHETEAQINKAVQAKLEEARMADSLAKTLDAIEERVPGARDVDSNAKLNGFAEYLDGEDPLMPEFTRREIAERMIVAISKGKQVSASMDRLAQIYAGFTGTEPKSPDTGKTSAMRDRKQMESSAESAEAPPDKSQYIMPSSKGTDKKPAPKTFMTVSSYEEELRKNRGGNFDATVARLLEKVRNGEVISG